jgi:tetratricopeptide (TPR) repeat protein
MVSLSDRLPDAVIDLIDSVSHECRVLIVVDDLHHIDSRSHEALDAIIVATSDRRVGWLFTTRDRARYSDAETPSLRGAPKCRVSPLDEAAARQLALSTSEAHGISLATAFVDSVTLTAGGNPLFIRELAVASRHRPHAAGLPESLTRVIEERLYRLSPDQRSALATVALLGETATLELVERAVIRPAVAIAADLNALEVDGVLSVSERRHLVLHECWRQAILDGLSATSRSALAKQCADVLSETTEGHRTARHDWIAAKLYMDAGYLGKAMDLFLRAADGLFAAGLPVESVRVVRTAQELARSESDTVELQSRLVAGLLASGEHLAALNASGAATTLLRRHSGDGRIAAATLLCARVEALVRAGRPLDEEIRALVELATDTTIPLKLRQGCALMGLVWAVNAGDETLRDEFHAASRSLAPGENPSLAGLLARVIQACESESVPEIKDAILALQAADTSGESMYLRCRAIRFEGRAFRQLGLHDEARKALVRSYDLAITAHLHFDASVSAEALTYIELDTDCLNDAEMWLGRFESLTPDRSSYERQSSMNHCRDRVLIQRGRAREALERLRARAEVIRSDWNKRRKLAELSTYAFCLADAQEEQAALESLAEVRSLLSELGKDFSSDYGAEMACRALRALKRPQEADGVRDWYVRETVSRIPHEFSRFYSELGTPALERSH